MDVSFNSIKEIKRLRKEINRLLSKGMSNILLRSYYKEKLMFSKLRFSKFKNLLPDQFLESPNYADIIEF